MNSVCLAILNYNGKKHLEHLLPTACAAVEEVCRHVVRSWSSTIKAPTTMWPGLNANFPAVQTIVAPKNDFLFSYNWLAEQRSEDILVLLNNDLKVDLDFHAPVGTALRIA